MTTTSRQSLLATFEDRAQADQFAAWIEQHRQPNRSVSGDLDLGPELANLLLRALRTVADGGSVVLSSFPELLSTTVAADVIGVSRSTVMRMVRDGELPHVKVGSHTRLRTDDVFAARDRRLQRKREALQELIELEDSLGL